MAILATALHPEELARILKARTQSGPTLESVVALIESLAVSTDGIRAIRWTTHELHIGMKEAYTFAEVESGSSEWASGRDTWTAISGSIQLQRPGDVCRDLPHEQSIRQVITIASSVVEDVVARARFHSQIEREDPRGAPFRRLHRAVRAGADRLALEGAVAEAIASLAGVATSGVGHTLPVRRALSALRESFAEPVTLDQLAKDAGTDKFHLCRAFRAQVGMSPYAYLTRIRIAQAKELLSSGESASEVAIRVGFYDQSQMNRHFRRIHGVTPGGYLRSARTR